MSLSIPMPVEFIDALSSAMTEDEIVYRCARWLPEILDVQRVSIGVIDGRMIRFLTFAGPEDDGAAGRFCMPLGNSLSSKVCLSGAPMVLEAPDSRGSAVIGDLFRRGYKSTIIAPLIADRAVLGVINLASRVPQYFDSAQVERSVALGRWIGSQLLIRQRADEMRRLALIDPMTGLPNRRAFMTQAGEVMAGFLQAGDGFGAVLLDIDNFKMVNDTYGHEAGDRVLEAVAGIALGCVTADDIVGRIGGEEFAILLPGAASARAGMVAEACRAAMSFRPVETDGHRIRVTASFGCAVAEPADRQIDDILRRADSALYRAKNQGRNRVCHAS